MPYDNPLLKELGGYLRSEEPGCRERADELCRLYSGCETGLELS